MRLDYRCYPCILDDVAGALELIGADEETSRKVMQQAADLMAKEGPDRKPPSYYITGVHRMIKRATGIEEPFADLRKRTNEVGIKIAARVKQETAQMPDDERFRKRVLWCVAANHLDFRTVGTGYGFDTGGIISWLESEMGKGLAVDMVDEFREAAAGAKEILYIHDNVGEVAVDTVLINELRSMGARVTSALRGGPITSDATMDDGKAAGVFDASDKVILAGPDTLGISLEEMTEELAAALKESDLIISKGQANYYVLTEYLEKNNARITFLFSTKCEVVSEKFNLTGKKNIVLVVSS